MSLKDLSLPLSIKTTDVNPIERFFVPALGEATTYDIAVGYFSSIWIRDAAEGIAAFACRGGLSRWIISPELSKEDYLAIKGDDSYGFDSEKVDILVEKSFKDLLFALKDDTRNTISWLVRDGILKFRIGVPINKLSGIMHAKMGLLSDVEGNKVSFSGSYNLTGAAASNWERIDIYSAWKSEESAERVASIESDFESMWREEDGNLAVFKPSDSVLDSIIQYSRHSERPYRVPTNVAKIRQPDKFTLRDYQKEAIYSWFKANGRGIFCMATGSGKTVTALSALVQLTNHVIKNNGKVVIVIAVPYIHLADQWEVEAELFGFKVIKCFLDRHSWNRKVQDALNELSFESSGHLILITVNATFSKDPFQKVLADIGYTVVFVADEMHNLGSVNMLRLLPEKATFRLGLSATPDRHRDEQGTKALEQYFGKRVIEFTLADAIKNDFLCKYYYYPVLISLTSEEMCQYQEISSKISKAYAYNAADSEDGPSNNLKMLLIKRSRLLSQASNKLIKLCEILSEYVESSYNLIYCGDTIVDERKYIDDVVLRIGKELKINVAKFTATESKSDRRVLLDQFTRGDLQALVAIRCLDEGIDIPRTENAFILASSTNPREFIQRRGRVLRKAQGKKYARIYDFIVAPDIDKISWQDKNAFNVERRLLKKELERVNEFTSLAINGGLAFEALRKIKSKLNLLDS